MERAPRDFPARVGRYEIITRLDTGGMAEILLGRLTGPSGFERAVVIKRILPHLARNPRFVEMFLDEARIAAGIRHPNVVHVEDLGREGEDLFLVLEYLEGETAASLLRRAKTRGRRIPPAVCAYIAAEACAGLHAAHEVVSPEGAPQNLVHRDVSPANVFLTYGGSVKILDFGIAKAADRIASTEAGQIKGKLAYMSPEQARGLEIDRRSDVYSLGVVLYELSTGKNPHDRATDVEALEALWGGAVAPPSREIAGYPAPLEAICLRALARERDGRFANAAEMRRELVAAQRAIGDETPPEETLARILRELFPDQIAEKRDWLQRARGGEAAAAGSPPAAAAPAALPSPGGAPDAGSGALPSAPGTGTGARRAAPAAAIKIAGAALGAVALAALGAALAVRATGDRERPEPRPPDPAPAPGLAAAARSCAGGAIEVSNLRVAWTTPNAVGWSWDAEGAANDLLRYELVVGADPGEVAARAASGSASASGAAPSGALKVWTEAQNPELGRFQLPRTESIEKVRGTITEGHAPATVYHGRLAAIDTRHCRSTTELVAARTAVAPYGEIQILHDNALPGYALPVGYALTEAGPHHAGSARHYEYRSTCPPGQAACWENLRHVTDVPLKIRAGPLTQGFVEVALACEGVGAAFWSELVVCFGDSCEHLCEKGCEAGCENRCEEAYVWNYAPFTVACARGGGYRVVQLPLRAFTARTRYGCARRSSCPLTIERLAAGKLTRFTVGGAWPRDAIVRVDEVKIRW
jgi:serine/threonine-protein kinase